jgi:hypothetical protein
VCVCVCVCVYKYIHVYTSMQTGPAPGAGGFSASHMATVPSPCMLLLAKLMVFSIVFVFSPEYREHSNALATR